MTKYNLRWKSQFQQVSIGNNTSNTICAEITVCRQWSFQCWSSLLRNASPVTSSSKSRTCSRMCFSHIDFNWSYEGTLIHRLTIWSSQSTKSYNNNIIMIMYTRLKIRYLFIVWKAYLSWSLKRFNSNSNSQL